MHVDPPPSGCRRVTREVPWVVIPTCDGAENVGVVIARAQAALMAACPDGYRILVVDDGSPDGTGRIAQRLAEADPAHLEVLHRPRPEGLGAAYLAGFHHALAGGASRICEMDADLSHDPADLARLLEVDADLVLGSRYVPGGVEDWSWGRRVLSRGGSVYSRLVLGLPYRDLTGGFTCFRAEVLRAIGLETVRSRGYAFQVELTWRTHLSGFAVREVPIRFTERVAGASKLHGRIALEAAVLVPRLRFSGWRPGA